MKTKIFVYLGASLWVINAIAVIPPKTDAIWSVEDSSVQNSGFISLFNGKDLIGWGYRIKSQDGVIFKII